MWSQASDKFNSFISNLEKLLINITSWDPHSMILIGEFNAKSKSLSANEQQQKKVQYWKTWLLCMEWNTWYLHILQHSSSYTNLNFVNHLNLVIDSGIHPSLHQNCCHQVIFCKFYLEIKYLSPYAHEVWNYGNTESDLINHAIDQFDWVNLFLDKNINAQVTLFNWNRLNIFHNFIPNKIILCDDRDPPWMNDRIKYLIKKKKAVF